MRGERGRVGRCSRWGLDHLKRAVGAVLARIDTTAEITPDVEEDLLYAADLVTLSRTACEYEFKTGLPCYARAREGLVTSPLPA